MITYRDAFPNENIYIHTPADPNPKTGQSNPQRKRFKYVYIWRALTPTGRTSKYYHALQTNDADGWKKAKLPKLRTGYIWIGPFLYAKHQTWSDSENQ